MGLAMKPCYCSGVKVCPHFSWDDWQVGLELGQTDMTASQQTYGILDCSCKPT